MATDIIIPADLWEEDSEGVITSWLVSDGAQVEAGTAIAEVMVEKAQFEVESQVSGTVELLKEEDDLVEDVLSEAPLAEDVEPEADEPRDAEVVSLDSFRK